MKSTVIFNWSSGKDSSLALYYLLQEKALTEISLFTTFSQEFDRVLMHGVPRELVVRQARAIGVPLACCELPSTASMEVYETEIKRYFTQVRSEGIDQTVFGDIHLEDLRTYREKLLFPLGFQVQFPLWQRDTKELIRDFLDLGFKAVIVSVQANKLSPDFLGRDLDQACLDDLPPDVDPCGENGEFHTFCYQGPIFQHPIVFSLGARVYKSYPRANSQDTTTIDGTWFIDVIPM